MVKAGRAKEMALIESFGVWDVFDPTQDQLPDKCQEFGLTWVDKLKGDEVRSRVCVQDFARDKNRLQQAELFAPTPGDECTRAVQAYALLKGDPLRKAKVSVAFLHAPEEEFILGRPQRNGMKPILERSTAS